MRVVIRTFFSVGRGWPPCGFIMTSNTPVPQIPAQHAESAGEVLQQFMGWRGVREPRRWSHRDEFAATRVLCVAMLAQSEGWPALQQMGYATTAVGRFAQSR